MGRRLLTLALLCAPAATGVVPTVSVSEAARTTERLQQHVMVEHAGHAHAGHAHAALGDDDDKRPARGAADATRNYFGDYLLVRDSTVRRWEDRTQQPIRVWVQPGRALVGWDDRFPSMVADAFREWERVGLPVRFQLVKDSVGAEVRVLWAEKLSMDESGRTVWWSTPSGFIRRAHVTLATHASDGIVQHPRALRAVALHEIGHVLGLSHTNDARDIMAPWVEVAALSEADRNTARILYRLPAGRVAAGDTRVAEAATGVTLGGLPVEAMTTQFVIADDLPGMLAAREAIPIVPTFRRAPMARVAAAPFRVGAPVLAPHPSLALAH